MEVIIIGAGTTGLLLAQGLKRANINATVYERETPEYYQCREREWGMSLHWGQEAIDKLLPPVLQSRMREIWCDPYYEPEDGKPLELPSYAGHTGEFIFGVPMPSGSMRVSRSKMRKLFSEGLDIQYGKRIESIARDNDTVIASFDDGTQALGTVLIGCDGSKSKVRELLVGTERAQNAFLGVSLMNFPCRFDARTANLIRAQHPVFAVSYHKNNWMFWVSIQDVPDPKDPESWLFQVMLSWTGWPKKDDLSTQKERTAFLRSKAAEYAEPWRTVLNAIPEDASFEVDRIAEWRPCDWTTSPLAGSVTVAGDAAHAMAPYRGQGLNSGLEDAVVLKEQLVKASETVEGLSTALRQYEAEMKERALGEIQMSGDAAKFAHDFDRLMESPIAKFGIRKSRNEDVQFEEGAQLSA